MNRDIEIDKSTQQIVPSWQERAAQALTSIFLGFVLVQIIGFWMLPGPGLGGLYMFSAAHSMVGFIWDLTNVIIIAFLALCGVLGWFRGQYFTDRLKGYIHWWKFW